MFHVTHLASPHRNSFGAVLAMTFLLIASGHAAPDTGKGSSVGQGISAEKRRVVEHWTSARRAQALPRDLRIDALGQAWVRAANGGLQPHGRDAAEQLRIDAVPMGKPEGGGKGGGDTIPPDIAQLIPAEGAVIGAAQDFSAVITDAGGIKSVSFVVTYPDGVTTQSFSPGYAGNDIWRISLSGFTSGEWSWHVLAKDNGARGGNQTQSLETAFTVDTQAGGGDGDSHIISNAAWTEGGLVQVAAGRIYFEMPSNQRRKRWSGYVCSGTVVSDEATGRSLILTAAHCVYDDVNKAFARNVLFIPDQAGTTGGGTDRDCFNDPLGCWVPAFGVVDANWAMRSFPENAAWDYAYLVVSDTGAHAGAAASSDALDVAAGAMTIRFDAPVSDDGIPGVSSADFTHALGYSYSDDPGFMFCAEDMTSQSQVNWWLSSCGLSGGASGGPWVQPMSAGNGPLVSVNSWGYTSAPGMAGPHLHDNSAPCLFGEARDLAFSGVPTTDGDAGVVVDYCP